MSRINRRDFLLGIISVAVFAVIGLGIVGLKGVVEEISEKDPYRTYYDPELKIWYNPERLTFEEAVDFTKRMDRLFDKIEKSGWKPKVSISYLYDWAYEVLPFFASEGISDKTYIPEDLRFVNFLDESHLRVAGRSDCERYAVLNARMINKVSERYRAVYFLSTIVHELAHVQQGFEFCATRQRKSIETSAEIATKEVLAALAIYGNRDAAFTLVYNLRGMGSSTALVIAMEEGNYNEYLKLRRGLYPEAAKAASFNKSMRYWANKRDDLIFILDNYSRVPYQKIVYAFRNNSGYVNDLVLGRRELGRSWLLMDDLQYFLEHAEELIDEFIETQD